MPNDVSFEYVSGDADPVTPEPLGEQIGLTAQQHVDQIPDRDAPHLRIVPDVSIPGVSALGYRREVAFSSIAAATLVETDTGARPACELKAGDVVQTLDNGLQPLIWTSTNSCIEAQLWNDATPMRIAGSVLGKDRPTRPIVVAPDQNVLVDCPDFEAILGNRQHLVAARDLLHLDGVERSTVADQLMVNLMCASHEILNVGGLWIDSFCPIGAQLNGLVEDQRNDLIALNPRLRFTAAEAAYIRSRPTMNADEAAELL